MRLSDDTSAPADQAAFSGLFFTFNIGIARGPGLNLRAFDIEPEGASTHPRVAGAQPCSPHRGPWPAARSPSTGAPGMQFKRPPSTPVSIVTITKSAAFADGSHQSDNNSRLHIIFCLASLSKDTARGFGA